MLLAFLAIPFGMRGQTRTEEVVYTLDGTETGGDNAYASESTITQNNVEWKVMGNTTMSPWRLGGKNITDVDRPIYCTSSFSDNITKVVVTTGITNLTVNSIKLVVSSNSNFDNATTLTEDWSDEDDITFERPSNADWSGKYFKIIYNVTYTYNSNKYAEFVSAKFYREAGSSSSITIDGEGITNNAISLPYNNTSDHTATVTATGLGENPELTLGRFTDSGCTTAYSGSDFTATLSGTTITYGFANVNTSHTTPRTFYMRVSSGTTNSNIITVTQGAVPYTVTFNLDGGTFVGNTPFPSSTTSIAAGTYALPSATKDNWNFGGWKLDGTETIVQAGANYTVSDNVSFTAQWTKSLSATYTVASKTSVTTSGTTPTNSSATFKNDYTGNNSEQMTGGYEMTLTLSGYAGQRIVGIVINMHSNGSSGAGYMNAVAGTTTLASVGTSTFNQWPGMTDFTNQYTDVTIPMSNGVYSIKNNEPVDITVHATANSLYCHSFTIIYQDATLPALDANDVTLEYDATSGEISYQLVSPNGSTLEASSSDEWISNLEINTTDSKVTFNTTENSGVKRNGTVTLTYGDISKNVKVTQNAQMFTVTYDANGGSGSMTDENSPYSYGETVTVKANSFTHTTLTFDSWNTAANGSGTSYTPNSTFTITSNVTLYAQWRGNHTYSLVSSSADLKTGKHYIIVGKKEADSVFYAMGSQGTNVRNAVAVSINAGAITEVNGIREFVISGDATNKWTIYDKMNPGYLYASGGNGNNYINTRANNEDANSQWAISFDNDTAYIVAQGTANRNEIRFNYNSGNSRFSCYSSASSLKTKAYIFVRNEDKDYEFYSNTTFLASATIANDETYTVHKPAVFEVTGTLTSSDPARLVIEDGAQMKISNNGVYATVKKFIPGYGAGNENAKAGYRLITQPLDYTLYRSGNPGDPLIENTGMLTGKFDFYKWDYTKDQEEWRNYEATGSDFNMNNNLYGYLYANESDVELNFAGPLRNNTSSNERYLTIEGTHAFNGWYLMGNSFVCNGYLVSAETDGTPLPYYRMNDDGDGFTAVSNGAAIAPMEGIFYQTIQNKTVYMVTTAPTPSEVGNGNLNITLAQTVTNRGEKSDTDNAIIRFDGGNTLEKFSFSDNTAKIYIPQDGKDYAVVSAEARGEMPVNFKAAKNGTYTISVETENLEVSYLHLIDNLTGENVDLLQTPSYTFTGKTSDYASRFRLVFNANNLNENDSDEPFAFISNDNIVVMNEGEATLQVIDMLGRVIETKTLNGNATIGTQANGVYVLRLINGDNVKTQKIVVK